MNIPSSALGNGASCWSVAVKHKQEVEDLREESEEDLHLKASQLTKSEIKSAPGSFSTKIKPNFWGVSQAKRKQKKREFLDKCRVTSSTFLF